MNTKLKVGSSDALHVALKQAAGDGNPADRALTKVAISCSLAGEQILPQSRPPAEASTDSRTARQKAADELTMALLGETIYS